MGFIEEKSDVTTDTKVENCTVIPPIENNVHTLSISSFEIATESDVDEPVFMRPCQLFGVVDTCSSRSLDMLDLSSEDVTATIYSSSSLEGSGQTDTEGKDDTRVDCDSETKCSGIAPSSVGHLPNVNIGSFEITTESAVEELVFLQPCRHFGIDDNCSSRRLNVPDLSGEDVTVSVSSCSSLECSKQTDNEGRDDARVDSGSKTKCLGIVPPMKENVCTVNLGSFEIATESAVKESVFLQPCDLFGVDDNCSRRLDVPDLSGKDVTVAINSSILLECSGQMDNEGRDDTRVNCGSETKCLGVVPPIEENISTVNLGSSEIATEGAGERSVFLQPCELFGIDDNCSSRRLDVLDLSGEEVTIAINSSSSLECSGQTDNKGRDDIRVDCGSGTKCSGIIPSSSRRSSRVHKASSKTHIKNIARKCRKTAKVPYPDKSTDIIFKGARRKRSCVSKQARSSIWGLLGNINQFCKENSELRFNNVQSHELQKVKASRGNGKRNKARASENPKGSRGRCRASSSCIRLKVKVGKEVCQSSLNFVIPTVVGTSVPANGTANDCGTESILGTLPEFPYLINGVGDKLGNKGTGQPDIGVSSVGCEAGSRESPDEDLNIHLIVKDPNSDLILEKSVGVTASDYLGVPLVDCEGGANTDPVTSPDSEVINLLQDAEVGSRCQEDVHDSVLTSNGFSAPGDVNCQRGKREDELSCVGNCIQEDGSPGQVGMKKAVPLKTCECRQKMGNGLYSGETFTSSTVADVSAISSSSKEFLTELLPLSTETEVGVSRDALKVESDMEDKTCCSLDAGLGLPESLDSKNLLASTKTKGCKIPKRSKSGGGSKSRSKDSDSARSRRGNACRKRENRRKPVKSEVKKKSVSKDAVYEVGDHLETGNGMVNDLGITNKINYVQSVNVSDLDVVSCGLEEQNLPPCKAWVCCDDCHKWRRIPAALADSISENCRWICEDNLDKAFADCSIPQEKSNAEINVELELSDASGEEDASDARVHNKELECKPSKGPQPASFTCIPYNEFLHRSRKSQTIDEIMVCHCKPPLHGQMGCGDECLNRMLNIECVRGTCPCGELCSNQQFQKREYAGMHWFPTGKKGYGLQLLEDVSKGQFLIEYVGEVLDMLAYEARQKKYASEGHKHFYFMTLNGSEVIDASAKGNMGRFINHSCNPNCRTEKWMVNGEICIGLFALRDMKKGEEVTFDYNYVRVFGAAAKKCYCGSPQCQGYIGGDPSNTEVIVQGDSDEEFPEPVMLFEDRKNKIRLKNKISRTKMADAGVHTEESVLKARNNKDECTTALGQLQMTTEFEGAINRFASVVSELHSPSIVLEEISVQRKDVTSNSILSVQEELSMEEESLRKSPSSVQSLDTSKLKLSKLLSDGTASNGKSKPETAEKQVSSKLGHRMKTSRSSSSVKKGKVNSDSLNVNKPQVMADRSQLLSIKPKKLEEGSANGRFEAVEVKLNELLDVDGGISKRKDAAKGYLKLLLLTAASGESGNGEAIQSNRELSMILDALLKTKSRIVLIDIINKNGLQMLHNIMKQYRRDFKKIPILRKLLKVLEYLAVREILTHEHINEGPPCPGMESFRESILSLTEHDDKQVHQIARSFRDKWIPRPVRKLGFVDRGDGREFHRGSNYNRFSASPNVWRDQGVRPTEAIDCVRQASPVTTSVGSGVQEGCSSQCIGGSPSTGTKTRKRKSRWDQPADSHLDSKSCQHKEQKTDSGLWRQCESSALAETGEVVSREDRSCHLNYFQQDEAFRSDGERNNVHEDVPPGFSSPLELLMVPSSDSSSTATALPQVEFSCTQCPEAVMGRAQARFISRLPVSYGIPLSIVQQCGAAQADIVESSIGVPAIPFYPFPPLPSCPRNKKISSPLPSHAVNSVNIDQQHAEGRVNTCSLAISGITASNRPDAETPGAKNQHPLKRARGSNDLGKRYFRQQKWNNTKIPPWLWKRNGWGFGNHSRNGACSIGVGNVENEFRNLNSSEGIYCRVEKAGNNCYQHPQHQNHH